MGTIRRVCPMCKGEGRIERTPVAIFTFLFMKLADLFRSKSRYSFLWRRVENDWDERGEAEWESRMYTGTLLQCCEKMYDWVFTQNDEIEIDYEAKAEHLSRCFLPHHELFPDLNFVDHPIKDLVP